MRISDWSSDVCSSDLSEVPAWKSQSSVASTLCQWDFCPASSRNNIAVAVPRAPSGDSTRQVSRYQPPSGWGCRSSLRISSEASLIRSEEHTSELQALMRISYAVFCLQKNKQTS